MNNPKVEAEEKELEPVLRNFRRSVHAWSEAEFNRPRTVHAPVRMERPHWRLAAVWAMGFAVAAGSVSAGLYEHHHRQALAQMAAEQQARQRQLMAEQQRATAQVRQADENLLAAVDKDVSRAVPAAMEPLAQLMDEDADTSQ